MHFDDEWDMNATISDSVALKNAVLTDQYLGNSVYDPDPDVGGRGCYLYNDYTAKYKRWRVFGSKCTVIVDLHPRMTMNPFNTVPATAKYASMPTYISLFLVPAYDDATYANWQNLFTVGSSGFQSSDWWQIIRNIPKIKWVKRRVNANTKSIKISHYASTREMIDFTKTMWSPTLDGTYNANPAATWKWFMAVMVHYQDILDDAIYDNKVAYTYRVKIDYYTQFFSKYWPTYGDTPWGDAENENGPDLIEE